MGTHVPYGSHSVPYHLAEVTFPPYYQRIRAGTQFSDPQGMDNLKVAKIRIAAL